MTRDLYLAIDVGTGGLRAALVDRDGKILAICHREHDQIVPRFGWSEQRPADWWAGCIETIRDVLQRVGDAPGRVAAICACGQMHGTVLIDADGHLTRDAALLWNDKRTLEQVADFETRVPSGQYLHLTANAAAPSWPAFKLAWIAEHDPGALARAATLLMPKDYINFKLTGRRAQDWTEASMSFLMDCKTRQWSGELAKLFGLKPGLLPEIRDPVSVLGPLQARPAARVGLSAGIPVLVGAGDYPVALLGSGVVSPGMGSDITGTSSIITMIHDRPIIHPEVSNVATVADTWGSLTLLDAGGDAVRWARRAFHQDRRSYAEISDAAGRSGAGSGKLFFLPYLSGERFGSGRNSRAQFFGLSAAHGLAELHRAVLEGVAFSVRQKMGAMQGGAGRPDRIVAAGGGAKSRPWLEIKASMYDTPYLVPEEPECGVVGAGIMMASATGDADGIKAGVRRMVRYGAEIRPDPGAVATYNAMAPIYQDLYVAAQAFYNRLDALP
ncbi:MAG: pentose kinase [Rhodobacteraceae bacterium]|nr:pentose kinase [Paracoccaceae bacterium]